MPVATGLKVVIAIAIAVLAIAPWFLASTRRPLNRSGENGSGSIGDLGDPGDQSHHFGTSSDDGGFDGGSGGGSH